MPRRDSLGFALLPMKNEHLGDVSTGEWGCTLLVKLSSRGLISDTDLTASVATSLTSMIVDLFSSSARAFNQFSSMGPSEIALTTAGDIDTSSTAGPSSLSTTLRFSNLVLRAVDRDCKVSISADTRPRSFWKLVREISTDFSTLSQA